MQSTKTFHIDFGVEFNARYNKELEIIKVYTNAGYDKPLIEGYKSLNWRVAQYRPERQGKEVLYWVFNKKMLPQVLGILEDNGYSTTQADITEEAKKSNISTKQSFEEFDTTEDELKLIEEIAYPNTNRWAERILREQKNFEMLMHKNPNLNIEFNVDNSREIYITIKDLNLTFSILLPLRYPEEIPVTKLEGDFTHTNFKVTQQVVSYRKVVSACLGIIVKNWNKKRTIAHFIKLFISYLTALYFNYPIPKLDE
jgi:hypothetical protein